MRPEGDAGLPAGLRHHREVALEDIEVEHGRGRFEAAAAAGLADQRHVQDSNT
ncbi:hypothetical protein [Vineibacter terrae]|uniref:hypothetical protein n=1 Tax=Vineibacter terrae TaxID=2586908 RepID=UPI001E305793|nr:hypothetical protein [Vineibacter terrae]